MTKLELNILVEKLIYIKDHTEDLSRSDRDAISDACNIIYHNIDILAEDTSDSSRR